LREDEETNIPLLKFPPVAKSLFGCVVGQATGFDPIVKMFFKVLGRFTQWSVLCIYIYYIKEYVHEYRRVNYLGSIFKTPDPHERFI
jgi:hypothetical protein